MQGGRGIGPEAIPKAGQSLGVAASRRFKRGISLINHFLKGVAP